MMKRILTVLLLTMQLAYGQEQKQKWGVTAITIPAKGVTLKEFYRAGGENRPATPTACKITYTNDTLYVQFSCTEHFLSFPAVSHQVDWYATLGQPTDQDAAFPDKVDLYITPEIGRPAYYHFAVTKDGQSFGRQYAKVITQAQGFTDEKATAKSGVIENFKADVQKAEKTWTVTMRIPWKTIGGKPAGTFGLIPIRTRWREAEVSSPVALDFTERAADDLYIHSRLGKRASVEQASATLDALPSGALRWNRPVSLIYPNRGIMEEIWKMQQQLDQPTGAKNIQQRIRLTQHWMDLLLLEGFNFGSTTGGLPEVNMFAFEIRRKVNKALLNNDIKTAGQLLDTYLRELNSLSRRWFADGSPGNILQDKWMAVDAVEDITVEDKRISIRCAASGHPVLFYLSLPETGGVRLLAGREGFFRPSGLLPLQAVPSAGGMQVRYAGGSIDISKTNATISLKDQAGVVKHVVSLKDIRFIFSGDAADASGSVLAANDGENGLPNRFVSGQAFIATDSRSALQPGEVIFGFGEKNDRFSQVDNVLTLWGADDWTGLTVGLKNESYKPVPVFHSSRGYMVFNNSSYRLRADIGKQQKARYRLTQHGPVFDYYFWTETPEEALRSYTSLTGKPLLPPKWAFGTWMGRTGRRWLNTPLKDPVAEQQRVTKRFAELDIPHTAIYAEGIGSNMPELHSFMAPRDIKVLSWHYSSIPEKQQRALFPGRKVDALPLLKANPRDLPSRDIGYVDFSHPDAMELSRRWWKLRLDLGVAGSMIDFGDRVPEDAVFYDGTKGDEMHNRYSYDYHRTYHNVFKERRGNDFILFGRAASPGTQQWAAQFGGDVRCNFDGLRGSLTGALNLCAGGFSNWGSDLGGFRGWSEPAVYMRWTQFSCFSPLMRCHGREPREPWEYGDAAVENYKKFVWVRQNLQEYIYNAAADAHHTGIPIMRAMAVAFPADKDLHANADQYMFGRDMLVAPVMREDTVRTIVFPAGKWTDMWTGKVMPARAELAVSLQSIPVFLREGAVVPVKLNSALRFGETMTNDKVGAMIITRPSVSDSVRLLNDKGEQAAVTLQVTKEGFRISLHNLPEVLYLVVYDAAGGTVEAVPEWDKETRHEEGRLIVRLPRGNSKQVFIKTNRDDR
ncbi:TIM-barrel domain-containing protein [Chitinophaga cymbidii]